MRFNSLVLNWLEDEARTQRPSSQMRGVGYLGMMLDGKEDEVTKNSNKGSACKDNEDSDNNDDDQEEQNIIKLLSIVLS
jgi:hypothetical protein